MRARRARLCGAALLAVISGCSDTPARGTGVGDFTLRFTVLNQLLAPVTIAIDDTVAVVLSNGQSTGLSVPPTSQWLSWTSAKPADAQGTAIPDDIDTVRVRLSGIRFGLEITNVIDDAVYITARMYNHTDTPVSVGVFDGTTVECASFLPAMGGAAAGFTQLGYYRLTAATEIRAYGAAGCTGSYYAWPKSQLVDYVPKSGVIALHLDHAP